MAAESTQMAETEFANANLEVLYSSEDIAATIAVARAAFGESLAS